MEKVQEKEITHHKKRKVSFFKKRKKQEIRPLVREHTTKKNKKLYFLVIFIIFGIIALCALLFALRFAVISYFEERQPIISPQGKSLPEFEEIKKSLLESGLEITNINSATSSSYIRFTLNDKTTVYLRKDEQIERQLDMVRSIERQMTIDGKSTISIDLRYNKPIVKF